MTTLTGCPGCGSDLEPMTEHAGWCPDEYSPDEILENLGADYAYYRERAEATRLRLYTTIRDAAEAGIAETDIARFARIDRMTVRKALGKR